MGRFRAYTSDTSEDEDEIEGLKRVEEEDEEDEQKSESESSPSGEEQSEEEGENEEEDEDEEGDEEEESEEEEYNSSPLAKKQPARNALVEDEDGEIHYSRDLLAQRQSKSPGAARVSPWAQHVDPQKMHVMQASLFRVPEETAALRALNTNKPSAAARLGLGVPSQTLNRKHSRDSDGDWRMDARERASFAHDVSNYTLRPSRKYARVEAASSSVSGHEGALADAGLAFGRSFRVGWGPAGKLAHLGRICGPNSTTLQSANTSKAAVATIPLCASTSAATTLSTTLLQHHLTNTPIHRDELGVPFAEPSSKLRFSSFASLFPLSEHSHHASLFRLGHALFDEQDLKLAPNLPIDIKNRVSALGRKAALSKWFKEVVASTVEEELKGANTPSLAAYTLLTGYQVDKACDVAADGGLIKLATLIAQAGSGDMATKQDLQEQLTIWKEEKVNAHIDQGTLKVYELLAGLAEETHSSKLDWKRAFAIYLWYTQPVSSTVAQVYEEYVSSLKEDPPTVSKPTSPHSNSVALFDGLFSLIRLHADPATSLTQILTPLSFSSSPADYAIPWHLYILLSRCMRVGDMADRSEVRNRTLANGTTSVNTSGSEDEDPIEGHSPSADLMTSAYAHQLESLGLIQEATFVLLHIEGSLGRKKAIKDLLVRSAPKIDDWMYRGLVGSLKIPKEWVDEAKAVYAFATGEVFAAYELYLSAGLYSEAHELAVLYLAPEAVIRQDLELLSSLFSKIQGKSVAGWHTRGKAFLDYANIVTRLPILHQSRSEARSATEDAAEATELDELTRSIPKLIGILPDVLRDREDLKQAAALAEMTKRLVSLVDKVKPLVLTQPHVQSVKHINDAVKLKHVNAMVTARFMAKIGA